MSQPTDPKTPAAPRRWSRGWLIAIALAVVGFVGLVVLGLSVAAFVAFRHVNRQQTDDSVRVDFDVDFEAVTGEESQGESSAAVDAFQEGWNQSVAESREQLARPGIAWMSDLAAAKKLAGTTQRMLVVFRREADGEKTRQMDALFQSSAFTPWNDRAVFVATTASLNDITDTESFVQLDFDPPNLVIGKVAFDADRQSYESRKCEINTLVDTQVDEEYLLNYLRTNLPASDPPAP